MKNLQLLALLFILIISACSTGAEEILEEDNMFDGSFEATLSGDFNKSFTGQATFLHGIVTTLSEIENGSTISLNLVNENDEGELINILVAQQGDLNGVNLGTYNVELDPDDGDPLVNIGGFITGNSGILVNESGSVTFTKIEDDLIEGSFQAELTNMSGVNVNVSGEFSAKGITENL